MNFNPVTMDPENIDPRNPMGMRSVILKSEGEKLLGTFFIAGGESKKPTVIILHGFPGNENNFDIAHAICRYGWNVLVFYYRGMWGSSGIFTWQNAIDDIKNIIELIKGNWFGDDFKVDPKKVVLIGHSMGGFFAANALVNGLVDNAFTLGLFNHGFIGEIITGNEAFQEIALQDLKYGASFVNSEGPMNLLDEMIKNGSKWNLLSYAHKLAEKNFYMISASKDHTSPVDMHFLPLMKLLKNINPQKEFGEILETGHSFSDKRITITNKIITWINEIKF